MSLRRAVAVAAAALAVLLLAPAADARQHYPARGHRIVPTSAPPLDGFTAASGAYGFRKLRSAYTGPAIRIRRASDNLEADIAFLGCTSFRGCPWDGAAAVAHCAATTCTIVTVYDQSSVGRNLGQATPANQPALIFNCLGALPCMELSTVGKAVAGASVTPATGVVSLSAVGNRTTSTTGFCLWFRQNGSTGNRVFASNSVNNWGIAASSGLPVVAAADGVWHTAAATINNATNSLLAIDGVLSGGLPVVAQTAAGASDISNLTAGTNCRWAESIVWDNYTLTPEERAFLNTNQRGFWGF